MQKGEQMRYSECPRSMYDVVEGGYMLRQALVDHGSASNVCG